MTNEANRLICERLAGYEVQVSPAGKHFIVTDEGTRVMPDFEVCAAETLSTVEALCKSRNYYLDISVLTDCCRADLDGEIRCGPTITSAIAYCLLQIAEGEE